VYRLIISLLLLCATIVRAQDKPFVRVRWKEATVHIVYQGKALEYNFRDPTREETRQKPYSSLFLADITSLKTMYLGKKKGVVRMLLNISGPSRGRAAASGNCGAGTESALVLFQFDQKGEVQKPAIVRYQSCLATIEPKAGEDDEPHMEKDTGKIVATLLYALQINEYDFRQPPPADAYGDVTVHVTFDPTEPERGIVLDENCLIRNSSTPCPAKK
jgi:hypothetical protein